MAVAIIAGALADDGPLTRAQVLVLLDGSGIRGAGGAALHLLMLACLRGLAVRGLRENPTIFVETRVHRTSGSSDLRSS